MEAFQSTLPPAHHQNLQSVDIIIALVDKGTDFPEVRSGGPSCWFDSSLRTLAEVQRALQVDIEIPYPLGWERKVVLIIVDNWASLQQPHEMILFGRLCFKFGASYRFIRENIPLRAACRSR